MQLDGQPPQANRRKCPWCGRPGKRIQTWWQAGRACDSIVYLLHFHWPYGHVDAKHIRLADGSVVKFHANHYSGKPASSGLLKSLWRVSGHGLRNRGLTSAPRDDRVERRKRDELHPPGRGEASVAQLAVELLAARQRPAARSGPKQQVVVGGGKGALGEQGSQHERAARRQQPTEAAQQVGAFIRGEVVDVLEQQHQVKRGRGQLDAADLSVAHLEPPGQAGLDQPPTSQTDDTFIQVDPKPGERGASSGRVDQVNPVPQPTSKSRRGWRWATSDRTSGASTGSTRREARAITAPVVCRYSPGGAPRRWAASPAYTAAS
jgi:hypothetical protein